MKIAESAIDVAKGDVPILPLVPEAVKINKSNSLSFKLRTSPAEENSPTFELAVQYLKGTETVREAINFRINYTKVAHGMNAAGDGAQQDTIATRLLQDTALTAYQEGRDDRRHAHWQNLQEIARRAARQANADPDAAAAQVNEPALRPEDVRAGMDALITYMTPYKALQRIKRFLRRKCRKPTGMKCRTFYNHFTRINEREIPELPPRFDGTQCLQDDEVIDILLFAFPSSWQGEMERQGFDPFSHTPGEILDFCERLEVAEAIETPVKAKKGNDRTKKHKSKNASARKEEDPDYYCMIHGPNRSHNTDDCYSLKKQIKEGKYDNKGTKNKSWSRKAEDAKVKSKKDLAAFISKTIRKEMNAMDKKRPAEEEDNGSNEDEPEEGELAAFDFSNLAELQIDSDDSMEEVEA